MGHHCCRSACLQLWAGMFAGLYWGLHAKQCRLGELKQAGGCSQVAVKQGTTLHDDKLWSCDGKPVAVKASAQCSRRLAD